MSKITFLLVDPLQLTMTEQQHPITPPPELVQQWLGEFFGCMVSGALSDSERYLATQAARWGADQELEACCADIHTVHGQHRADWLRSMRRPKPPSLAEQALAVIETSEVCAYLCAEHESILCRALERLQELENND